MKKIKLLVLLFISSTALGGTYRFQDQPIELTLDENVARVSFLMRASSYKVDVESKCFEIIRDAIKTQTQIEATFSPKDLKILSCK